MERLKTFFKYLLLVIGFYIFSQIIIHFCIQTSYEYIPTQDISEEYTIIAEAKAKKISGFVKVKVLNSKEEVLTNKYIKLDYYSKRETLLGTDYIEIDRIEAKEEKEFEIDFKYENVQSVKINIVNNK